MIGNPRQMAVRSGNSAEPRRGIMAIVRKRIWTTKAGTKTAWQLDYRDSTGKRRAEQFTRKKDADTRLVDIQGELKAGTHTPVRDSITVAEAADIWLERGRREGLERGTLRNYTEYAARIKKHLGIVKLAKLTEPAVHAFRDRLLDTEVSRTTARAVLTCFKGVLKEAKRRGLVAQNVALGVTVDMPSRHQRKIAIGHNVPSKHEVSRIINAAEGRWRPLLITAVFTGMRASELRGLPWADVDFERKVIHIRQRANYCRELGPPKSHAGQREIPMSPMVANTLREWKLACPKLDGVLALVFPNGAGKVELHSNLVYRGWRTTQVAAGIVKDEKPKYNFHSLRHFAASWMIEQGFSPKRLQAMLGHSSIQITFDRYGHLFPSLEDDHARFAAGELSIIGG
jgi:integrase